MGLNDAVEDVLADEAEVTVNSGEGTAGESPGLLRVVGDGGVGVLEEGDEDEPVVDPEVGDEVGQEDLGNTTVVGPDTDQIHGPTEELVEESTPESADGRLLESLLELSLAPGGNGDTLLLRLVLLGRDTALRTGAGNENLVTGKVAGGSVVAAVRDTPRVVRDKEGRVENPSDTVVDGLGRRVGLVTALVGDNPDTGTEETRGNLVADPESDTGGHLNGLAQVARNVSNGFIASRGGECGHIKCSRVAQKLASSSFKGTRRKTGTSSFLRVVATWEE